jgi:hypothetical protein
MTKGAHPVVNQPTKKSKKIYCYKDDELIATYDGLMIASRATGIKFQNIYKTCKGYKTTLKGLTFTYDKREEKEILI